MMGSDLTHYSQRARVIRKNGDFQPMQRGPEWVSECPIGKHGQCHRRKSVAGVPLVDPISDHTGAHGTIRDGSQRNLADDTHLVFDGENHADAMLLITALLGYLIIGHTAGAVVGGIAGLIVSALAVRKYDRSLSRIIDTKANILSVIGDEDED